MLVVTTAVYETKKGDSKAEEHVLYDNYSKTRNLIGQ